MEESLKTGRLVHILLLAICASAVIFAIAPGKREKLSKAIFELETIENINLGRRLHESITTNDKYQDFLKRFNTFCSKIGCTRTISHKLPNFIHEGVVQGSGGDFFSAQHGKSTPLALNQTVYGFIQYMHSPQTGSVCIPFWDDLRGDKDQMLFLGKNDQYEVTLSWDQSTIWIEPRVFQLALDPMQLTLRWEQLRVDVDLLDFIRGDPKLRHLLVKSESKDIFLPETQVFLNEIGNKHIQEAKAFLIQRREELKESLTLAGIPIPGDQVRLAAPILITVFCLYLAAHVSHITSLTVNASNRAFASEFPWLLLFAGGFSRLLAFASVVVVPSLSISLLWRRALQVDSTSSANYMYYVIFIASTASMYSFIRIEHWKWRLNGRKHWLKLKYMCGYRA